jgi:hypothetical protein
LLPIQQACSIFNNQQVLPALPKIHNNLRYFFHLMRSSNPKDNNSFYLPYLKVEAGANFLKKVNPNLNILMVKNFNTRCRAIKRIGPHNIDVISTIFGLLLGDGYANNRSGEGVRIAIKQSEIHKEYLFFLYQFFFVRGYCSNLEPRKYYRRIKGIDKVYSGYEFNTFTFRSLLWIYKSFYKNGKKILPINLEKYMNEIVLSI